MDPEADLASLTINTDTFAATAALTLTDPATDSSSSAEVTDEKERKTLLVTFTGEGDLAALPLVDKLMKDLHQVAVTSSVGEVILDLRAVSFMSSSCFSKLIVWVTQVRKMETGERYKIRIKSDAAKLWQRRSMDSLQCFAIDLITIDNTT